MKYVTDEMTPAFRAAMMDKNEKAPSKTKNISGQMTCEE